MTKPKTKAEMRADNQLRRIRFVLKIVLDRLERLEDKVEEQEENTAIVLQAMTDHLIHLHKKIGDDFKPEDIHPYE